MIVGRGEGKIRQNLKFPEKYFDIIACLVDCTVDIWLPNILKAENGWISTLELLQKKGEERRMIGP